MVKKFKILNHMLRNNRVITKKPFVSEIIKAKSKSEALKEGMKESRRWNKFSRKTHEGQKFRTKIVKVVEIKRKPTRRKAKRGKR